MTDEDQQTLTFTDAAKELGISRQTLWRMVRSGEVQTVPISKRKRVPRSEVVRLSTPQST